MTIARLPYPKLQASWPSETEISVSTPWIEVTFDVDPADHDWIQTATKKLFESPGDPHVQKFLESIKDYFTTYTCPRPLRAFNKKELETKTSFLSSIETDTPLNLLQSLGIPYHKELEEALPAKWTWDVEPFLKHAHIPDSTLYDPVAFVSFLMLYRLEQDGKNGTDEGDLYQILEEALQHDENLFFKYMGWVARQSHFITSNACHKFGPAMESSPLLKPHLEEYRADELGHHKFMEQTLEALGYSIDDFDVGPAASFLIDVFEKMGTKSLLTFICLIGVFEPPIHEQMDPLSALLKRSSKPEAARGYDLHYKINLEHDHANVAYGLCHYLGPQPKEDCVLTIRLFELCLLLLSAMEAKLPDMVK